jgi:hypothetical protein
MVATANFTTKPPMRDKLGMLFDEEIGNRTKYIVITSNDKVLDTGSRVLSRWVCEALGKVATQNTISRTFSRLPKTC